MWCPGITGANPSPPPINKKYKPQPWLIPEFFLYCSQLPPRAPGVSIRFNAPSPCIRSWLNIFQVKIQLYSNCYFKLKLCLKRVKNESCICLNRMLSNKIHLKQKTVFVYTNRPSSKQGGGWEHNLDTI